MNHSKPTQEYPLSLGQERIWFEEHIEPGTATYNVPYCFRHGGPINVLALEQSLLFVVDRHEVLRKVFAGQNGQGVQIVGGYEPAVFFGQQLQNHSGPGVSPACD